MAKRNKIMNIKIERVDFPNKGIATAEDGRKIEIKGGIPGQVVEIQRTRSSEEKIKGKFRKVIERSPLEEDSHCQHFEECGGCSYQTLSYERELELKKEQLQRLFLEAEIPIPPLDLKSGSAIDRYRNKMEYTFGDEYKGGPLALGLHKKGFFHEIVNTTNCNIVHSDFIVLAEGVRKYFDELGVDFYHRMRHKGYLRHLMIRRTKNTKQILINLVTSSQGNLEVDKFMEMLKQLPLGGELKSVYHTINDGLGDVIKADELHLIYGEADVEEEILGLRFNIGPFSFFQTNTESAEKLYQRARELLKGNYRQIFDLYSGTGTIAQILSPMAEKIVGIEIVEEAVAAAKEGAKRNNLQNVEFIAGDVLEKIEELSGEADAIVLDPPREGVNPKALKKILDFAPDTFLYISCNPVTMARDLPEFLERGYQIKHMEALDQFPRTPHVETVVLMSRK